MLIAKVIAVAYFFYGLIGLVTVADSSSYSRMFHEQGKPLVGLLRVIHAYVALLFITATGISVWFFPAYAAELAITTLIVLIVGKVINLVAGSKVKCVPCLVAGVFLASLCTWVIVSATTATA